MTKLIRLGTHPDVLSLQQAARVSEQLILAGFHTKINRCARLTRSLFNEHIDVAVCPASHLAAHLYDELEVIALTPRQHQQDVVLTKHKKFSPGECSGKTGVATRLHLGFLHHYYPHTNPVVCSPVLTEAVNQLNKGKFDALIWNLADVLSLKLDGLIAEKLETSYFVPAVGGGSLAVVCHKKLDFEKKEVIQRKVNDVDTEDCIRAERAYLKNIPAGLREQAFGYAFFEGNLITLKAGLIPVNGKKPVKVKKSALPAEAKELGKKVALDVLLQKKTLDYPG